MTGNGKHAPGEVVTFQGRSYLLWQGKLLLNWRDRRPLWHSEGCRLCCTFRVEGIDKQLRHPGGDALSGMDDCPKCGTTWDHRRPDLCHLCGRTAHFRDDAGQPVHKTCLEQAILSTLLDGSSA